MKKISALRMYLLIGAIGGLASATAFTIYSIYMVETVGLNPFQLVLVGTTIEISAFLFEVPTGVVADTYSRRLSVILGHFFLGFSLLLESLVPVFAAVLVAQVIGGLGYTFNSGALEAWITDEVGEEAVGKAFVRYGQVRSVTGFAGIALGVYLATIDLYLALVAAAILIIGLGIVMSIWMPETGFQPDPDNEQQSTFGNMRQTLSKGVAIAKSQPVVWLFLLMGVVFGAYSESFDRLWEAHLLANFTFYDLFNADNVVWFGIIRAGSRVINLIASEVIVRRIDMTNHTLLARILLVGQAFVMLGTIVLGLTGNFILAILAVWTIWLMRYISYPISGAWLNQVIDSKSRATVLSLISQSDALGQMVGGPGVGWLATVRSMRVALVVGAGLLMPAFPLYGTHAFKKE